MITTLSRRTIVSNAYTTKYAPSPNAFISPSKTKRDVLIIGGGHNGLVAAAYLAQKGLDVLVLERRHCIGGAAVTEEIYTGFKYSRASYLAGLLRPQIITDLNLHKHGFKYLSRDPSSFTPTKTDNYLLLGQDPQNTFKSIAQFSKTDAESFPLYESFLEDARAIISPILDAPPPDILSGSMKQRWSALRQMLSVGKVAMARRKAILPLYELFTAPASVILNKWFQSDILKATLATDSVIGAMVSPMQPTSGYVLLHHVMGEADGRQGVWAYVEGGMGALSESIASCCKERGVEIATNATVKCILSENQKVKGVVMQDGTTLYSDVVVSNATPFHTFTELLDLPHSPFTDHIQQTDYSCGAFKINCAINSLPNFTCCPNSSNDPQPVHRGTIHFESTMEEIDRAWREASRGIPATRPVIEMTIPSAVDTTLSPKGQHVCQLFVQFAPYHVDPSIGSWSDQSFVQTFADRVFSIIDEFAPGFSQSVLHRDILSPLDLEHVFGLHQGNIFHGALSLHQLGYLRPAPGFSSYRTPVKGLYLCGAGTHPGGGVMGAPGRNCAKIVLGDVGLV